VPGFLDEWRADRQLRRGAARYREALFVEPADEDVRWLAAVVPGGDLDRARWELRYARRALGLLVAQRDALDDRTGSAVARELHESLPRDPNVAHGMAKIAESQFNHRLRQYGHALVSRVAREPTAARLGRALLAAATSSTMTEELVARGGEILSKYITESNESLRGIFGVPSLREDLPPSAQRRR
jgi:hypothetical protein